MKREAEIGIMLLQAKDYLEPTETKTRKDSSPETSKGAWPY